MKTLVCTDSTSDITKDEARQLGVIRVPLHVIINGKEDYLDGETIEPAEVYSLLDANRVTTSQPNTSEFLQRWQAETDLEDEIVVITISSVLSKTFNRAVEAAGIRKNVWVVDSLSTAAGLRLLVLAAQDMAKQGVGGAEIAKKLEELRSKVVMFAVFDTLKYLAKGGRIGKAQGMLGAMLNIKPIITLEEGEVASVGRERSKLKAIRTMLEKFTAAGPMASVAVMHTANSSDALFVKLTIENLFKEMTVLIYDFGPTLGVYAGSGLVGVAGIKR